MADAPERPAELDPIVPFPPMEAELVRELPLGDGWAYEPKWDGFRGVLENVGGELRLWSRNGRPLLRYFPELQPLAELLPPRSAIDGEIVIDIDGAIDFDAMQTRLHPPRAASASSRPRSRRSSSASTCCSGKASATWQQPFAERRAALERDAGAFTLSPSVADPEQALAWLEELEFLGLDGVVAKRLDLPVEPGGRGAVVKVKPVRTADCVVVGVRWKSKPTKIATLLLGLYDDEGEIDYVGSAAVAASKHDAIAEQVLPLARRGVRPPLLGAEPLGRQRARGAAAAAGARRRGALRQGAGHAVPARHQAAALPAGQGSALVHLGRAAAAAGGRRADGWGSARR